jgi:anti-sigma factor RsiW
MIYCQDCVDLLSEFLDGTLPEEKKIALEEHLSYCPPCITFMRTYRATSKICRKHLARSIPDEVSSRLHDFLNKAMAEKKS